MDFLEELIFSLIKISLNINFVLDIFLKFYLLKLFL